MFDRHLLTSQRRVLQGPARWLSVRGVSADSITLCGFVFGLAASGLVAQRLYATALAFIILNRIFDGLDGAIARERGPTDRGAFMDIALDFFFYATVPFGFALADPAENALAASALLLAFVGTGSSFLAFSVIAAKRGVSSTSYPQKGIYYLGGLTEGGETFVAFAAMCLRPASFAAIAWVFTILALITTATRWWWGWRIFSERKL